MTSSHSTSQQFNDRERLAGLVAAIVAISVAAAGFGHSIPLLAVLLEHQGASSTFIGCNSAIAAGSIVVGTPIMPALIKRLGLKPFITACVLLMIAAYGGLFFTKDALWMWFPIRFIFSFGAPGLFVASEFWISTLARDDNRGAVIGIYGTCLALGFALGPFLIQLTGYYTYLPFLVGGLVFSAALLSIAVARAPKVHAPTSKFSFFPLLKQAPATFLATAFFGGTEASIFAFLPIIILDWGLDEQISAQVVTAYALGAIGLQFLIGKYSDRFGRMAMLMGCTLIALTCTGLFTLLGQNITLLFIMLFVWGASVVGLSTIGLAGLGDYYKDADLAAANTGYAFMYGVGALITPAIVGLVRDQFGNIALPFVLALLLSLYFLVLFLRRSHETP